MDQIERGRIRVAGDCATIAINPDRSYLAGWMSVEDPARISWSIEVEGAEATIDTPVSETMAEAEERLDLAQFITQEGCNAEIRGLVFPLAKWRELDGVTMAIAFNAADVHPILPDNPANFCYGTEHHVPEKTRVAIGPRQGRRFRVVWRFSPARFAGEAGGEVEVDAFLPLREIVVYFPDAQVPDVKTAVQFASRISSDGDLGDATVDRNWVHIAVNPVAD